MPARMQMGHGLVPHFAPQGVVGQPIHLLGQAIAVETFNGLGDPRMQGAPALVQHARRRRPRA